MPDLFIADTHFGHQKIIEYDKRPFKTVEEMDAALIRNWNRTASKHDRVFVLGDFSFYDNQDTANIVSQLQGHKILVMGNHDKKKIKDYYNMGFNEVYKHTIIVNEFLVLSHKPPEYYNEATPYFYIYGHVHSTEMYPTITKNTACVCTERWNYTPVKQKEIQRLVIACK